jgi:hypothetical protein
MASAWKTGTTEIITTLKITGGGVDDPQDWADLTDGDNVTAQESPVCEAYKGVYDHHLVISGATNNATYLRIFRTAPGEGHVDQPIPSVPDYTGVTMVAFVSTTLTNIFDLRDEFSQIQGMVAKSNVNSASNLHVHILISTEGGLISCLTTGSTNIGAGAANGFSTSGGYVINALSSAADNCFTKVGTVTSYWYNFTAIGGVIGVNGSSGNTVVKNGLASGASSACYLETTGTLDLETCGSSDGTGVDGLTDLDFNFVNPGGINYHLELGPGVRIGKNLSADANYPFDDDGAKVTWGDDWDLGFLKFTAAAGGGGLLGGANLRGNMQ